MSSLTRRFGLALLPALLAGPAASCGGPTARVARSEARAAARPEATVVSVAGKSGPSISSVSVEIDPRGDGSVRLTVASDRPLDASLVDEAGRAGTPRSAWLAIGGARLDPSITLPTGLDGAALRGIRHDGERLVFDVGDDVEIASFVLGSPSRWVLDFRPAVSARTPDAARGVHLILLDPGHGGHGEGAAVGGVREADLVLDIARRVSESLVRRLPGVRVVLTRNEDVPVALEDRTTMANTIGADLYVSIHLDDADATVEHGGVTTFVLDGRDRHQGAKLAARENGTSEAEVTGMQKILADLHREGQLRDSRRLAELVQTETLRGGRAVLPTLHDRGVRRDVFSVLVGARMPAVLVEASFMARPDELAALRTVAYRRALAEGIARGIVRYASDRGDSVTFLAAR